MALPGDVVTLLAALFMLFGVPLILFSIIFLYTGYVRHDAERYLEELEAEDGEVLQAEDGEVLQAEDGEALEAEDGEILEAETDER
ncbi:hypothetical protein [Natrarchaeobius oligotrophus]|uniref:Uncharacterized protein n=1 Tax=Natrarchaeobius chitinivorans TaxID=1679083 RepID=A0A3N6PMZ6_NATCH|nr:hypothetical protein [Natrarchaeobius chitinivorans]RQH03040.1 hypothetical protein EA472_00095 [Natrarchaeobius chitinivorans]